jgi:16S rRNA (uracil1498-N3)-methyltransferase
MHRCYIEPAQWAAETLALSREEAQHLAESMRAQPGVHVLIFDGAGRTGEAEVLSASGGRMAQVLLRRLTEVVIPKPSVQITLVQALPKGRRMDDIVDRATELGVSAVIPVVTDRTIVRSGGDERDDAKAERWRRVALSAAKQCGVAWLPEIFSPMSYRAAWRQLAGFDRVIIGSLYAGATPFHAAMEQVRAARPSTVALIIGPEGDFTEAEIQLAVEGGAIPVGFGPRVLRTDMAATYGLAVLAYELGR